MRQPLRPRSPSLADPPVLLQEQTLPGSSLELICSYHGPVALQRRGTGNRFIREGKAMACRLAFPFSDPEDLAGCDAFVGAQAERVVCRLWTRTPVSVVWAREEVFKIGVGVSVSASCTSDESEVSAVASELVSSILGHGDSVE
jgi:hypothetical protein